MTSGTEQADRGDLVHLSCKEDYDHYVTHMKRVYNYLLMWYAILVKGGGAEHKVVEGFLKKILRSVELLGIKYSYHPSHTLALDLHDSGYPHFISIMDLQNDSSDRESLLQKSLPSAVIKEQIITRLFETEKEPMDLLWNMASRQYLEMLNPNEVIFPFTFGDFILLEESTESRRYQYSWSYFDVRTNIPYLHLMVFDQDKVDSPLHEEGIGQLQFKEVIKAHGSRVPDMLVLSGKIDDELEHVHPKVVKRIKLGPILSNTFSFESQEAHPLLETLKTYGTPEDFLMLIRHEILRSRGQAAKKLGLLEFGPTKIREVFAINMEDDECSEAKATTIERQILLPHHVLQHIDLTQAGMTQYANAQRVVYNDKNSEVNIL